MIGALRHSWIYLGAILIPLLTLLFLSDQNILILFLLLSISGSSLVYLFNLEKILFYILAALLVFSVELPLLGDANIAMPAEGISVILAGSTIWALILDDKFRRSLLKSVVIIPVVFLVLSYIVSLTTSSMGAVSAKFITINIIYILVGLSFFRLLIHQGITVKLFFQLVSIGLILICLYSIINLIPYSFNPKAAPIMARPFFKDHTILSATLAMFIFVFSNWKKIFQKTKTIYTPWFWAVGGLLGLVIFISSSRAAWISIFAALFMWLLIWKGISFKQISWTVISLILAGLVFQKALTESVMTNQYESTSETSSLKEQILSAANMSTDVSNLERLNRWKCAVRMFLDRPLSGFGPGTYQFQYLPYQRGTEMTTISVISPYNNKLGKGGSAHSEYLLLLSENGILGFAAWVLLLVTITRQAFKLSKSQVLGYEERHLMLASALGLVTYFVHSFFNNYLNVAQFGISFWMLVSLMMYYSFSEKEQGDA